MAVIKLLSKDFCKRRKPAQILGFYSGSFYSNSVVGVGAGLVEQRRQFCDFQPAFLAVVFDLRADLFCQCHGTFLKIKFWCFDPLFFIIDAFSGPCKGKCNCEESFLQNPLGQFTRNYTQTTKRGLLTTNKG